MAKAPTITASRKRSAAKPAKPAKRGASVSMADRQVQARVATRSMRARFDAAQTNSENANHWAMADGLSADVAASPAVRRTLRNRARYEVGNNTYARGIVNTLANDCVGTGPRLQLSGMDRQDGQVIEKLFATWCDEIDLPEKLRTMRTARAVDGEGFGLLVTNPNLDGPIKLDLRLVEAEQIASPWAAPLEPNHIDGIRYDVYGNPDVYELLPQHPGGMAMMSMDAQPIAARQVLHYYIVERPGQRRGIPELTAALPLFAQLRRWTLSVLAAAETASDFAAILQKTGAAVDDDETDAAKPFDRIEIERRAMMTLPEGWALAQLKAEQPTSTYSDVKREILGEIGRVFDMPYNIAAGNSSGYNYSSGRLDHQTYFKRVKVDRHRLIMQALDPLFAAWRREAILIEGYLPQSARMVTTNWSHRWFFDGFEHVDPSKEAVGQAQRLVNKTTTLAEECAKEGKDWEEVLEQAAKEQTKLKALGLAPLPAPTYSTADDGDDGDNADESDHAANDAAPSAAKDAAASGAVQSTALNGAQVVAIQQILQQVASGALGEEAAVQMILLSFPLFKEKRVRDMVKGAKPAGAPKPAAEPAHV